MSDEVKKILEEEYNEIYKKLNIKWELEYKKKIISLKKQGLINSGIGQKKIIEYIENLMSDINKEIKSLLSDIQDKFNFIMSIQEINCYINKSISNNNNFLEKFWNDLSNYYKKQTVLMNETDLIYFNNIKMLNKQELEKIRKKLIANTNIKTKNKEKKKIKEKCNFVIGLIGVITSIISAITGIITFLETKINKY